MSNINGLPILLNETILLRASETALIGSPLAISIEVDESSPEPSLVFQPNGSNFILKVNGLEPGDAMGQHATGMWRGSNIVLRSSVDRKYEFDGAGVYLITVSIAEV